MKPPQTARSAQHAARTALLGLTLLAACGAEGDRDVAADTDLDAAVGACDAIAIPCCERATSLASCSPASSADPERWSCGGAEIGTSAYEAACVVANPDSCPAEHPVISGQWRCADAAPGDVCWYPAAGCTAGEKAANVCTCAEGNWQCGRPEAPFRTCFPPTAGGSFVNGERPLPTRLAPTGPCADPAAEPREATCTPHGGFAGQTGGPSECARTSDCATDEVCLEYSTFPPATACRCAGAQCLNNADCAANAVCDCGFQAGTGRGVPALSGDDGHLCLASTCRSDADCEAGGICAASVDGCGWRPVSYACHYPGRDACLTDVECPPQSRCLFDDDAQDWRCVAGPSCN